MSFDAKTNGEHACAGQFAGVRRNWSARRQVRAAPWRRGPEPESEAKSVSPPERARRWTPQLLPETARAGGLDGVDLYLVQAVVQVESNFEPARSVRGTRAVRRRRLPSTAEPDWGCSRRSVSVAQRLDDLVDGLLMGSRDLAEQLAQFDGEVKLALAA